MKLYESAVRKPISTILIFVAVLVLGVFSLNNLAVDMYPEMEMPAITLLTVYEGANASDIETNVTRVLEDNLNTVDHLKDITSTSSDNISLITLEFEWGSDLDEASNDIRDAVNRTRSFLPDDVDDPSIFKFSSSMIPVLVLSVTADESYTGLNKLLDEQLVNRLNRIDGVGSVSMMGAPEREIQINVDPRKMEAYNLTVEQLGGVIAAENINIPAGTIDLGNNTINVKTDGEFNSSDDLYDVLVTSFQGRDIYLRDVAQIKDTLQKETLDERINGHKGVRVVVQKQAGSNTVNIVDEVMAALPSIQKNLPPDIEISVLMDGSENIRDSIDSLSETIMFAFLFVILVVLFFLGRWRATLIICLTIPVSLVTGFIYLYLTGSTLNIISLSSMSIAIGMVVDDAIVVLENITTHMERGSSSKEAAIYGTNEVWLSVIATTLTVVAVFLPLTLVSGMAGVLFRELGWMVSIIVTVSTITAITLTPMLSSKLLKSGYQHSYKGLGVIFRPIDRFLDRLDVWYAGIVAWAVRHRSVVMVSVFVLLAGGLFIATKVPSDFTPPSDNGSISMKVELDQNTAVEYTKQVARTIDTLIKDKYPYVERISTSAGSSSDNSNIFSAMSSSGSHIINYTLKFPKAHERDKSIFQISDELRLELADIPEIKRFTVTPGGGGGGGGMGSVSTVEIKIFGYDFDVTNEIAADLKSRIEKVEGARDVVISREDMRPEYNVQLDRNRLAYYGLNSSTVSMAIRNRINGYTASKYREDGDEYDIIVRYDEPYRTSIEEIENIVIYNSANKAIRVGDVGTVVEEFAPPAIQRENRQRIVKVTAMLGDGVALGTVVQDVNAILENYSLPDDVSIEVGGTLEDQQESFGDLITLFVLIIMLVYIVMATQFESFVYPFIIMITMVLAVPGVFLALWITNTSLSLMALIGAIMLVGIVVKNGIVMVDYTNLLRERGAGITQAVIAAGKSRLRPVLMTSLTTILGMLPMALGIGEGSELWQPMGIAIIGGLVFSTILTLVAVPVMYSLFGGVGVKRQRRKMREQMVLSEKGN